MRAGRDEWGAFGRVEAVGFDARRNLYILDDLNSCVVVVKPDGEFGETHAVPNANAVLWSGRKISLVPPLRPGEGAAPSYRPVERISLVEDAAVVEVVARGWMPRADDIHGTASPIEMAGGAEIAGDRNPLPEVPAGD